MKIINGILYQFLRLFKFLVEILPLGFAMSAGKMTGRLGYYFTPVRRRITIGNLMRAFPDKNRLWCHNTARKVYENFGRNIMEYIKYGAGKIFHLVDVEGLHRYDGGALLMMGHLGQWEITGMSVAASGRELYPIGRRISNPAFDKIVLDIRETFGSSYFISARGSIREVLRKIKAGKNICVLIDQRIKDGIPVKFFNRPVWSTYVVSVLHRKTGIRVVPGYSRHVGGRIKVVYEEPIDFSKDKDSVKADFINTQKQMNWIEKVIREKPDEWFWMHNFWKDKWKAVFLDRDGTINKDCGYVSTEDKLEFIPGAMEAMRKLRRAGYLLVVVTNQSGVARGYYTERDYFKLNKYFLSRLESEGVIIDRVYHCPHHPDDNCCNRKPNPGMIIKARDELNIDLEKSFVIGDKASDIGLGKRLGVRTVMVMTGYGSEEIKKIKPDYQARDLLEASELIVNEK